LYSHYMGSELVLLSEPYEAMVPRRQGHTTGAPSRIRKAVVENAVAGLQPTCHYRGHALSRLPCVQPPLQAITTWTLTAKVTRDSEAATHLMDNLWLVKQDLPTDGVLHAAVGEYPSVQQATCTTL
jgi:hypothetical protein